MHACIHAWQIYESGRILVPRLAQATQTLHQCWPWLMNRIPAESA